MINNEYISISEFAKAHNVPDQAVLNAISVGKLKPFDILHNNQPVIHKRYLTEYKFELIGIYEYADRKGITFKAVYKRLENSKHKILHTVDPNSDLMKIDWELYKDEKFRSFSFKYRGKNNAA